MVARPRYISTVPKQQEDPVLEDPTSCLWIIAEYIATAGIERCALKTQRSSTTQFYVAITFLFRLNKVCDQRKTVSLSNRVKMGFNDMIW